MDGSEGGMAAAAAAREALKRNKIDLPDTKEPFPLLSRHAATQVDSEPATSVPTPPPKPVVPCRHEVAVPEGFDPASSTLPKALYGTMEEPEWTGKPAKEYPFVLDSFQAQAVACIERQENVLVAAHTSAGKTAVAEYAIAKALAHSQRVFYTSPIKALSNQKFRELSEEFGDVGLMTGDVSINPTAACIVLTTEILRSMIYKGSELLREVAWIIFDEVHYMQDRERGVIWEETIIFSPKDARMVFLSATLSNASEFAAWVAAVHGTPTHVVYTEFRPTPLRHYAFPPGGHGLFMLLDENGAVKEETFATVQKLLAPPEEINAAGGQQAGGPASKRARGESGTSRRLSAGEDRARASSDLLRVLRLVKQRNLHPVIAFSFSRREVEANALSCASVGASVLDFTTSKEKAAVDAVFEAALGCLSEDDRGLRAVQSARPLLRAGIGVHHSGLLPLVKELVEILFQEGLIKCLFATETFAMGLNMPARTVIFCGLRKWDGRESRWLTSGEYIQMSGRAGRRGKDPFGMCIMMLGDSFDRPAVQGMIQGKPAPLLSSFRLSYYTLLNLLRRGNQNEAAPGEKGRPALFHNSVDDTRDVRFVISRSFAQFQHERSLPALQRRVADLEREAGEGHDGAEDPAQVRAWTELRLSLREAEGVVRAAASQPQHALHFLRPGRLVHVSEGDVDWGWGVVVAVLQADRRGGAGVDPTSASNYVVDALLCCAPMAEEGAPSAPSAARSTRSAPVPGPLDGPDTRLEVVPVPLNLVDGISSMRIGIPTDLRVPEATRAVLHTLRALCRRYPGGAIPRLDPVADQGIDDPEVHAALAEAERLRAELEKHPLAGSLAGATPEAALLKKAGLLTQADELRRQMRNSQLLSFEVEAKNRADVLKKLGYVDEDGIVTLKGRVACEISTSDELLTTELMLNGTFNRLDSHQLAALISCLIQVERSKEEIRLTHALSEPLLALQTAARQIAEVSVGCLLEMDVDAYVQSFWPYLMDVMYEWSRGASFARVCDMTDIFEGSIVRATRRLDELMQELEAAAEAVGNETMRDKIAASRETIRRDIMFSASLYI